jgi:hypothetical protein
MGELMKTLGAIGCALLGGLAGFLLAVAIAGRARSDSSPGALEWEIMMWCTAVPAFTIGGAVGGVFLWRWLVSRARP